METRYTVRQTVEMTGVKSYVLRYWEEELELQIHRNELGHRYYTGYDIQLFLNIKELKRRGLQLRAIKKLIPQITASMSGFVESGAVLLEGITEDISEEGQSSAKEGADTKQSTDTAKAEICNNEKILEFQTILERLIAQELRSQNEDEERCRSLDFAIRRQQMARREAAAASEKKEKANIGMAWGENKNEQKKATADAAAFSLP